MDRINPRSLGVKLVVVCALAVSMTIPGIFVGGLLEERTKRAADVAAQVSASTGGPQTFLGPTLMVPYANSSVHNAYAVFPASGSAVLKTVTEERRRSLFKVPVFRADLAFEATFDGAGAASATPPRPDLNWNNAEIVVGVTDARGALEDATLTVNGKSIVMAPAQGFPLISFGSEQGGRSKLSLLGARLDALASANSRFTVSASMRFSGAQRVALLAYGRTTQVSARGDWPNPGFDGGFLPAHRAMTNSGYTARWSIPFIARGVGAEGPLESLAGLDATALGTSFIEMADPYQSVNRCLKYVLLFVGLIFLSYFALEVVTGTRIHPAQYLLVGVGQIIFYLLLLSLAERIGFDWAFAMAGAATVGLLATNAAWVFSNRLQGIRALFTFTLLYVLIYFMLRAEDYALLLGAITSFAAVAAAMYLSRKIDWYTALPVPPPGATTPPAILR